MSSIRGSLVRKAVVVVGALALSVPLVALHQSPVAAAGPCTGDLLDSGAMANCRSERGGSNRPIDSNWTYLSRWSDPQTCNAPEHTGERASAVRPGTRGPVSTFCIRSRAGDSVALTDAAKLQIPLPTLKADYKGSFLTGAEVTFDVGQQADGTGYEDVWARLPLFNNVWLHAQPEKFRLDFGDGSPVSEWDAADPNAEAKFKHIYSTKSPGVTATLTVTWMAFLHGNLVTPDPDAPALDPNDPANQLDLLGDIERTSTMTRPIVEVWSALTEPTKNV